MPIVLRLRNASDAAAEVQFTGRLIAFDIVVKDERGAVVWQRLAGAVMQPILQIRTLAPGEVVELRDVWRAGTPGRYELQGAVPLVEPGPLWTTWKTLTAG